VEEMNEGLIERWNECVKKGDTVYHLGDFCLTVKVDLIDEWLSRLNGTIRLIRGNHDNWIKRLARLKHRDKFKWIDNYKERRFTLEETKYHIIMCHFPMLAWHQSQHGSFMLHGHCHSSLDHLNEDVRRLDVGVDGHNWYPWHLDEIVAVLGDKELTFHHPNQDDS